jgi:hypothetical protein
LLGNLKAVKCRLFNAPSRSCKKKGDAIVAPGESKI